MSPASGLVLSIVVTALVAALFLSVVTIAKSETFRDSMGRVTGTSTTRGNVTTFTDNMGREKGYAERRGNTTTIYNEKGQERGTVSGRNK